MVWQEAYLTDGICLKQGGAIRLSTDYKTSAVVAAVNSASAKINKKCMLLLTLAHAMALMYCFPQWIFVAISHESVQDTYAISHTSQYQSRFSYRNSLHPFLTHVQCRGDLPKTTTPFLVPLELDTMVVVLGWFCCVHSEATF